MASKAAEWISKNINKYEDKAALIRDCVSEVGISVDHCRRIISSMGKGNPKVSTTMKAKTLTDFRNNHDVEKKIKTAIESIPDDGYVTEQEVRDASQVDANKFARFKERFSENFIIVRDRGRQTAYWAKSGMIKKMRGIIEL